MCLEELRKPNKCDANRKYAWKIVYKTDTPGVYQSEFIEEQKYELNKWCVPLRSIRRNAPVAYHQSHLGKIIVFFNKKGAEAWAMFPYRRPAVIVKVRIHGVVSVAERLLLNNDLATFGIYKVGLVKSVMVIKEEGKVIK